MKNFYICRVIGTNKYVGRGVGNSDNPNAYGLTEKPADSDWRGGAKGLDTARQEAWQWGHYYRRCNIELGIDLEIVDKQGKVYSVWPPKNKNRPKEIGVQDGDEFLLTGNDA